MTLSDEDQELFFSIYYPLLFYSNNFFHVSKKIISFEQMFEIKLNQLVKIRDKIFNNRSVIDYFIEDNKGVLGTEKIDILTKWKENATEVECLYFRKKNKSIFYNVDTRRQMDIVGISDDPDTLSLLEVWPVLINSITMSFQGKLIWDGLFRIIEIVTDKKIKEVMRKIYEEI
jgi:hypothetical protein